MERTVHDMSNLFAQLGEPSDEGAIKAFIEAHAPLPGEVRLHEAGFWSDAQARFLSEAISQDSDWAQVADALNSELHAQH